jgi:hypothetical protein
MASQKSPRNMSLEETVQEMNDLDAEIQEIRERKRAVAEQRNALEAQELDERRAAAGQPPLNLAPPGMENPSAVGEVGR